jgi:hypothetical protein
LPSCLLSFGQNPTNFQEVLKVSKVLNGDENNRINSIVNCKISIHQEYLNIIAFSSSYVDGAPLEAFFGGMSQDNLV